MTRFARSRGSKAHNDRQPEEATPWALMKRGLAAPPTSAPDRSRTHANPEDEEDPPEVPPTLEDLEDERPADIETDSEEEEEEATEPASAATGGRAQASASPAASTKKKRVRDKCLACRQKGHRKMDCPTLSPARQKELRDLVQLKIERKGHGTGRKKNKKNKSAAEGAQSGPPKARPAPVAPATPGQGSTAERQARWKRPVTDKAGQLVQDGEGLFQGFRVKDSEVVRLSTLQKTLQKNGATQAEMDEVLKRERRRAEKELAKSKKMVCYNCRQPGHFLSDCPQARSLAQTPDAGGHCFKCGSLEHTAKDCQSKRKAGDAYAFAQCFVCKEKGHLAKACPDNPRGLYPNGGGCRFCGSVEHLKSDCPRKSQKDERQEIRAGTIQAGSIEDEPELKRAKVTPNAAKTPKVVAF